MTTEPGTTADVHYDFTQFGLDKSQHTIAQNLRTSQIIDPPDGRLPPQVPAAAARAQAQAAALTKLNKMSDVTVHLLDGANNVTHRGRNVRPAWNCLFIDGHVTTVPFTLLPAAD